MLMTSHQHLLQMLRIPVHTACMKTCVSPHGQCQWIKRVINAANGCGLSYFILFGSGRILSFGQTVDLVIE